LIVLDASAAVELLTEEGEIGAWVAETLLAEDFVAAPHLIDLEVLATLRKMLLRGAVARDVARGALLGLRELRVTRYPVTDLLDRIWELRSRLTPYDASYVALAEAFGVALVTTDSRLMRAGGHRARIVAFQS
jgi:predicted nucleic acid-binding protein